MNVLIIHAHPEEKSFCTTLKNTAVDFFNQANSEVVVSDLYAMNFNPVGGKGDFINLSGTDFFKYQLEQVNAFNNNLFIEEIKIEMEKFVKADLLIFNFPLWWFSLPAILKGWVDRVFAMGFAYGAGKGVYDSGTFKNKKTFCCITTGGPATAYGLNGRNGNLETILYHINHGMLYFVGIQTLPPFVGFSPVRLTEEERQAVIENYKTYLQNIDSHKPIF
jgi:NAD(P)H dehydrogenase (quinone)